MWISFTPSNKQIACESGSKQSSQWGWGHGAGCVVISRLSWLLNHSHVIPCLDLTLLPPIYLWLSVLAWKTHTQEVSFWNPPGTFHLPKIKSGQNTSNVPPNKKKAEKRNHSLINVRCWVSAGFGLRSIFLFIIMQLFADWITVFIIWHVYQTPQIPSLPVIVVQSIYIFFSD